MIQSRVMANEKSVSDVKHKHIEKQISEIHTMVKEQNGRVKKNEIKLSFLFGGLAVISAVLLPLAFIVIQTFI